MLALNWWQQASVDTLHFYNHNLSQELEIFKLPQKLCDMSSSKSNQHPNFNGNSAFHFFIILSTMYIYILYSTYQLLLIHLSF